MFKNEIVPFSTRIFIFLPRVQIQRKMI